MRSGRLTVPPAVIAFIESDELRRAIAEAERLTAATQAAVQEVIGMRKAQAGIAKDDLERFAETLRRDPGAPEKDSRPELPGHSIKIDIAAKRAKALEVARDHVLRDVRRLQEEQRPAVEAATTTAIRDQQRDLIAAAESILAGLERLDALRSARSWAVGGAGKAAQLRATHSWPSPTPPSLAALIADVRDNLARVNLDQRPVGVDEDDVDEPAEEAVA